jgi:hypothetical protein
VQVNQHLKIITILAKPRRRLPLHDSSPSEPRGTCSFGGKILKVLLDFVTIRNNKTAEKRRNDRKNAKAVLSQNTQ